MSNGGTRIVTDYGALSSTEWAIPGPRVYIEAKWSPEELATLRRTIPDEQAYREQLLATQYTMVLETRGYRLWTRRAGGP